MKTLRIGDSTKEVTRWQNFLRGQALYGAEVDGHFGSLTRQATVEFQQALGLHVDGIVGNETFAAAMLRGFEVVTSDSDDSDGPNWPPRPSFNPLVTLSMKQKAFGRFDYKPAGNPNDPEAIVVLGDWVKENITKVTIPQLKGISGANSQGEVFFHELVADHVLELFHRWEEAGLTYLVLSWGGRWVPRFIRGSRTTLSNHAFGTAFDINSGWNSLGTLPRLKGRKGSVRELVPIANELGFYWGGHFRKRQDGMHFELAKL